jgi:type VI secretion system protein VasG
MILGMLKTPGLRNVFTGISREFAKLKTDDLSEDLPKIVQGSPEDSLDAQGGATAAMAAQPEEGGTATPGIMGKQEALARFSVDLTERARKGEIDPIVGRDAEIRQIIDILMRRRQNNPILTGEAGVGKTAVVEGFALRISAGDVPPALKDVVLRTLDLGLLQAGASYKGEFENRLRQIIDEVKASPSPSFCLSTKRTRSLARGEQRARATRRTCSNRPWPGGRCERSPQRRGANTRSILKKIPR